MGNRTRDFQKQQLPDTLGRYTIEVPTLRLREVYEYNTRLKLKFSFFLDKRYYYVATDKSSST